MKPLVSPSAGCLVTALLATLPLTAAQQQAPPDQTQNPAKPISVTNRRTLDDTQTVNIPNAHDYTAGEELVPAIRAALRGQR